MCEEKGKGKEKWNGKPEEKRKGRKIKKKGKNKKENRKGKRGKQDKKKKKRLDLNFWSDMSSVKNDATHLYCFYRPSQDYT